MTNTAESASPSRPELLALPSTSTGRYGILLLALLATGMFVGSYLYTAFYGVPWIAEIARCPVPSPTCTTTALPVQSLPFLVAALLVLAAGLVIYLAPIVIVRRRGLQPIEARFQRAQDRVAVLCADMGLHTPPALVSGSSLRDAFCFGRPGRIQIAVPKALLIRPEKPIFEAVLLHELAHVRHRDVALAWLARSAWWALAPLLAIPVILGLISDHLSLLADYLWRAAVFAAVVLLVQRDLLRAREHEADLRAAHAISNLEQLVEALPVSGGQPGRRLLRWHPDGSSRRAVLRDPSLATRVSFGDGISVGFLVILTLSILDELSRTLLTNTPAQKLTALAVGPILGATLGLGLCRQAVAHRTGGPAATSWPAISGVFGGAILGLAVSFVASGSAFGNPMMLLPIAAASAGATAVAAGLAVLLADATPAIRHPAGYWLPVVLLTALPTSAALVATDNMLGPLEFGGWAATNSVILRVLSQISVALIAIILGAAAAGYLWLGRRGGDTPQWLVGTGKAQWLPPGPVSLATVVRCGLTTGATAAILLVICEIATGASDPSELVRRVDLSWWVSGATGAATSLIFRLWHGPRGTGAGLLSSVLASIVVAGAFLVENGIRTEWSGPSAALSYATHGIALSLLLSLAAAWLPLPRITAHHIWINSMIAGLLVAGLILALGSAIVPRSFYTEPASATNLAYYGHTTALELRQRFAKIAGAMIAIDRENKPSQAKIASLNTEVAAPLELLIMDETRYQPPDTQVAALHAEGINALVRIREVVTLWIQALRDNNSAEMATGNRLFLNAIHQYEAWQGKF